jgi:signal transduction histidine kinase
MWRLLLLLLSLFAAVSLPARTSLTDSLQAVLANAKDEAAQLPVLRALCRIYSEAGADSTVVCCQRALEVAGALKAPGPEVESAIDLGYWYHKKSQYQKALSYYYGAAAVAEEAGLTGLSGSVYNNLALSHQRMSQPDSAYFYWNKAEAAFQEAGSPAELWKVYLGLFQLFSEKQDTAQANRYATLAHQQVQRSPLRSDRGYLLFQLLQYYFQTGQFEKMGQFQQLWDDYKREQKPDEALMQQPAHIALYMFATQEEGAVEAQLKEAIRYFEQSGIPYRAGWCYEDLAKLYHKQGKQVAAEQAMQQALGYYREAHVPYRRGRALNMLYQWKKERGATAEALAYLEAYEALEDSLTNITVAQNLNALRVKAETEKKEQALQIKDLELEQKTQERNALLIAALLLAILAVLIFLGLRQRLMANRRMARQEQALQEQRILQLEQENRLSAMQSMIQGQEQERSRIANDLHDSLGGIITAIQRHVSELARRATAQDDGLAQRTVSISANASQELRRIAQNLMPRSLTLLGLEGALEDLAAQLEAQGLRCQFQSIGLEERLPEETAVTLFRIVQELINNIVKHAQADQVLIQLLQRDGRLFLTVEDDGKGFDLEKARQQASLGMGSVASRVSYLKGDLDIDTAPGQGTSVSIAIPL